MCVQVLLTLKVLTSELDFVIFLDHEKVQFYMAIESTLAAKKQYGTRDPMGCAHPLPMFTLRTDSFTVTLKPLSNADNLLLISQC